MGADDYMTKPFSSKVLIAKVNTAIRRCYGEYSKRDERLLIVKGLTIDENTFKLPIAEAFLN